MSPFLGPLHLLLFNETFAHDLVNRRLYECRADGIALTVSFAEVWDECTIVTDVGVEFRGTAQQLGNGLRASTVDIECERQVIGMVQKQVI